MLNQIEVFYRFIRAEKARSDVLVEEGRQLTGWHRPGRKHQSNGQE